MGGGCQGLRETSAFVHGLIAHKAWLVGVSGAAIGGLSQGCAGALHALLNFQAEAPLLEFIGMSGWLPFPQTLGPAPEEDIFGAGDEEVDGDIDMVNSRHRVAAAPYPRRKRVADIYAPVFLGHGTHDEKVPFTLGERARDVLQTLGCDVEWNEYDEGHWYKVPDEIDDLATWLKMRMGKENYIWHYSYAANMLKPSKLAAGLSMPRKVRAQIKIQPKQKEKDLTCFSRPAQSDLPNQEVYATLLKLRDWWDDPPKIFEKETGRPSRRTDGNQAK
ncbi:Alpha/Beta hydrolase protein [Mycena vulgaris]|nr:Alpha/Beta hydrolase protein [Mycena vulgaris]